jgi:hypothetical protein
MTPASDEAEKGKLQQADCARKQTGKHRWQLKMQ